MRSASLPAIALAVGMLAASGCRRPPAPQADLDMPAKGTVSVLARQVESSEKRLEYQWTLLGERNWSQVTASGADLTMAKTYDLNDPTTRGGANVFLCDLTVTRSGEGSAAHWTATIEGTNGLKAQSSGDLPGAGGDLRDAVRIRLDHDERPRLPADLALASVGEKTLTLHVAD